VILIFCAFGAELDPLRARIRAEKALELKDVEGCYGTIGSTSVALAASGIGTRRAQVNARRVFDGIHGIDLIIMTGVAGALIDDLKIGDLVMADRLLTREGDSDLLTRKIEVPGDSLAACSSALDAVGIPYSRGGLLTVRHPLMTQSQKRLAGQQSGAIAVDMETAVIAFEAAARGIPFVAMRTVMDTVEHDLEVARLADENGVVRPLKAAAALMRKPSLVAGAVRLMRNLRLATRAMALAVEAVARQVG
jgi:adenosylhomocysteine nucleosidase